jgi:hypothetical protein
MTGLLLTQLTWLCGPPGFCNQGLLATRSAEFLFDTGTPCCSDIFTRTRQVGDECVVRLSPDNQ